MCANVFVQIKAGETHPIYITDNINGGGEDSDIIYGGSDSSMGTVAMPFTFTWTPNMCDQLYSFCNQSVSRFQPLGADQMS